MAELHDVRDRWDPSGIEYEHHVLARWCKVRIRRGEYIQTGRPSSESEAVDALTEIKVVRDGAEGDQINPGDISRVGCYHAESSTVAERRWRGSDARPRPIEEVRRGIEVGIQLIGTVVSRGRGARGDHAPIGEQRGSRMVNPI